MQTRHLGSGASQFGRALHQGIRTAGVERRVVRAGHVRSVEVAQFVASLRVKG